MYSPRGVIMLAHNHHDVQGSGGKKSARQSVTGIDNEWLTPEQGRRFCPPLEMAGRPRYPCSARRCTARRGGAA